MRIIYVDDEKPALDNFRLTTEKFPEISNLHMFQDGNTALEFATENVIDVAFLDMQMPGIHGLELARKLKELDVNIRVIFVTAYSKYALDAWSVDASGYLLKPYTASDIRKELAKCTYRPLPSRAVVIQTIPSLHVTVNGVALNFMGLKPREMFALLVDRGEVGFTAGECIACLWPDKENNASTQSLFRMTYKRLLMVLEEAGIGHIVITKEKRRFLKVDEIECDLYRILSGDRQAASNYHGEYLKEYSWAEEKNSQIYWMLNGRK